VGSSKYPVFSIVSASRGGLVRHNFQKLDFRPQELAHSYEDVYRQFGEESFSTSYRQIGEAIVKLGNGEPDEYRLADGKIKKKQPIYKA